MTQAIHPRTGRPVYVPGVYTAQDVVDDLPGASPEFMVPIIAGSAHEGVPYNVGSLKYAEEGDVSPFVFSGTSSHARGYWGRASDIGRAWAFAKRHGLPEAYSVCLSALTRASVLAQSTGPVNEFTIYAKKYGAPGGYIKLKIASGTTIEVIPVKHFAMLTANLSATATRVYVTNNDWVQVGMPITIGSNTVAAASKTVTAKGYEIGSDGLIDYWVEINTAVGGAGLATSGYALICFHDTTKTETSSALTTGQQLVDWFNDESDYLGAHKHANFTNATLVALGTSTCIKDISAWSTVAVGTSPAATSSDWDAFITAMDASLWDDFALRYQKLPQAFLALDSSSTVQQAMRDWGLARRDAGTPISIITGCAWGDTVIGAGNDTAPEFRSAALNSQDFALCAGGIDREPAYISLAAAVFGRRVSGGVGHNLTNDELIYSEVEKRWDETNSGQLTTLHRAGVITYRLSTSGNSIRYVISQGISTLQSNDNAWNDDTEDTPLLMQRDIADYIDKDLIAGLDGSQVGADEVDPSTIAAVFRKRADRHLRNKLITEWAINSITLNATGTGYDVNWSVRTRVTNDFISVTTRILVG